MLSPRLEGTWKEDEENDDLTGKEIERRRKSDVRQTPQTFSHFTYVQSKGTLIVTDIQGVCDMYTDPQVR